MDESKFAVIERDNQGRPDTAIKKIYAFSVEGLDPQPQDGTEPFSVVEKSLVRELIPHLPGDHEIARLRYLAVHTGRIGSPIPDAPSMAGCPSLKYGVDFSLLIPTSVPLENPPGLNYSWKCRCRSSLPMPFALDMNRVERLVMRASDLLTQESPAGR